MEKSNKGSDFQKKRKGTFSEKKNIKGSESKEKTVVSADKGRSGQKERKLSSREKPLFKNHREGDQGRRSKDQYDIRKDGEKRPYRKQGPDEHSEGPDMRRERKNMGVRRGDNEKSRNDSEKGRGQYSQKSQSTYSNARTHERGEERKERKPYKTPGAYREHKKQEMIRLNKYISNAGYCSRREADTLISTGAVTVDGKIITELGYKVNPQAVVRVDNQTIKQEKQQYILLNKPKDVITTCDDPQGRLTVLNLIKGACKERLYPVGRLDRNTTGLLIMTNDGDFAKKIAHPSSKVKKLYEVTLDKRLKKEHFDEIEKGVWLDQDNFVEVDDLAFADGPKSGTVLGIEIHSGKYHVVKRIFEKFGYTVTKLDRTKIDILTKKDLPRGRWRFLTDSEIQLLKRY